MSFLAHWWGLALALAGIILLVKPLLDALGVIDAVWVWLKRLWKSLRRSGDGTPTSTLAVIVQPRSNALWWGMGKANEKPIMQICADFYVTNKLDHAIRLAGAVLKVKRFWFFTREFRGPVSVKDPHSAYSGNYPIPPHYMADVRAHFFPVHNPFCKEPKAFTGRVAIIDQYGNKHWLRCKFKHLTALHE